MKKLFLILTSVLLASCAAEQRESNIFNVVPYPNDVQVGEGVFDAKGRQSNVGTCTGSEPKQPTQWFWLPERSLDLS